MKIVKGVVRHPRRVLLYGVHGCGKSTWASEAPSPLFVDIEGGLSDIDCERTPVLGTMSEINDALTFVLTGDHQYRTLVIDTVDWLEAIIHRQVAISAQVKSITDIGYGKGYGAAVPIWHWVMSQLDAIRAQRKMGVILLSHAKIQPYQSPTSDSYDRFEPDLHKSSSSVLQEWCDEVLFADYRIYTKQHDEGFNRKRTTAIGGKERFLTTCESATCLPKNRASLPAELPMAWSAYAAALQEHYAAKPAAGNIEGIVTDGHSKPKKKDREMAELESAADQMLSGAK